MRVRVLAGGSWLALALAAAATLPSPLQAQPYGLQVENLTNPLGVDVPAPRLSWQIDGAMQVSYQVRAAGSANLLDQAGLWDSGKVDSSRSNNVAYGGPPLGSRQRVVWQVRVWTDRDPSEPSAWSAPAFWEMGLLTEGEWSASWIGLPQNGTLPLPVFTRQFNVSGPVQSARLYIAGFGVYEARINGRPVSEDVLAPGNTLYPVREEYATLDVTGLLAQGENTIAVELGNGTYNLAPSPGRYGVPDNLAWPPVLRAQLEISSLLGTETIVTDGTWKAAPGPTTTSTWWGGEDYDARRLPSGWDLPGANLSGWGSASVTTDRPPAPLTWRGAPGVRITERLTPVAVAEPQPGIYVFDMGVNFAGWFQLQVSGPAGTKVTMRIGEILNPDGTVNQSTAVVRSSIFDTYTLSGNGVETWHPKFAYHGFRYLQVSGLPAPPTTETITGFVLRAANESAGSFSSSNALLNDIHKIIDRSIQSNMMSIFTDCPDREKLGWLGDVSVMLGSITRNYSVAAYLRNVVRNMADSQTAEGLVPDFVPAYYVASGALRDDPNWGNAITLVPWALYEIYGDVETLRTYYPNMQRYVDYLSSEAKGNLIQHGLGDWETPEALGAPSALVSTYGYYRAAQTLGRIAAVLGRSDDAAKYAALATSIADAFNASFLDRTNHLYNIGQQAADALALDLGIVPEDQRQAVLDHLVATIRSAGNHAVVGIVGLQALLHVLAAAGRDDVIYDIANQTTYPSYGYEIVNGATSLTETWSMDTGSSFNHMMFGAIDEWFTSGLAGIQQAPGSVGYEKLVIKPAILGDLTEVRGTYQTPNGLVVSEWTKVARGGLRFSVTIPGNTTAAIWIPAASRVRAPSPAISAEGAHYTVYNVGPGTYHFEIQPRWLSGRICNLLNSCQ